MHFNFWQRIEEKYFLRICWSHFVSSRHFNKQIYDWKNCYRFEDCFIHSLLVWEYLKVKERILKGLAEICQIKFPPNIFFHDPPNWIPAKFNLFHALPKFVLFQALKYVFCLFNNDFWPKTILQPPN